MMKAYVIHHPGGPEVLQLEEVPDPVAKDDQVVVQIKAFGLNRAESITRNGGSGEAVKFPRIIGIECVGVVVECPSGMLKTGQTVAAMMGGMGRQFDGSYAEKTAVPLTNVIPLETHLSWEELAAIPETFLTAWGCLFEGLKLKPKAQVVVRPGASALGLAITQIVNYLGGEVIGVTRSQHKVDTLLASGMKEVIVSSGAVAAQVRKIWPTGPINIVETITSSQTIKDDLQMKGWNGRLCIAGSLSASSGNPPGLSVALALARPSVKMYSSETITAKKQGPILQEIVNRVENGRYRTNRFKTFSFDQLHEAHRMMEENRAAGKLVVTL